MRYDDSKPTTIITVILFGALVLMLATSCKSKTVYVPVETVRTEYKDRLRIDSLIKYDSIFQDRYIKGDTVFLTREKYKYVDRIRIVRDSVVKDSVVQVPYEVKGDTEYVEKRLTWSQLTQVYLGRFVFVTGLLYFLVRYRKSIFAFLRKVIFKV